MFTWETAVANAALGGTVVATFGHLLNVDPFWILVGVSIVGSLASVGFRWMGGFLKDWKQRCMAFVAGVIISTAAVPYLASKGLEDLEASIFVLFISLFGARLVKYLSTDFDVGTFINGIIERFKR